MSKASAAILCGGQSKRMGFDKSLLVIDGSFVLGVLAEELATVFDEVLLVTNEADKLRRIPLLRNCRVVTDLVPGCGPLGGIATALTHAQNGRVFVMGCDMPVIDHAFIGRLRAQKNCDVALPRHGDYIEPLYAVYGRSCLPAFIESIKAGRLAIRASFVRLRVAEVDAADRKAIFANLNHPEDLENAPKHIATMKVRHARME